ncbi:DUF6916 family protein [Paenibacillus whitsoniae]|uniref:DUF6916 domain-containing protein n=1 Tax=Paenibacillus whitsoniae TaxID=2496558 RepID=A0A430JBY9_9BACL|nr:hypothetical protein [Paenibacillus whitsoniae]RTE08540.1 hypothetical protein EJQ19_17055 [Paenibacillus whitsoniae]
MNSYSEAVLLQESSFQLPTSLGEPLILKVKEVKDKGSNDMIEQFSLLLEGPLNVPIQQGLYELLHEKLGSVQWLLVPIARGTEGFVYEVVFNLLKSTQ